MFRAMALKELREIRGIVLLAVAAYGYLVSNLLNPRQSEWCYSLIIPFTTDNLTGKLMVISAAMAVALGLRQTLGESLHGTYPFLFHRPASRRLLIGTKLAVGLATCVVCSATAITVCGLVAARPGTHASPFQWSMTLPAWEACFRTTLLYFGAFLVGIRPGRWYRSRLLPLAAAVIAYILLGRIFFGGPTLVSFGESLWPCLVTLVGGAWVAATILFVARIRDYP